MPDFIITPFVFILGTVIGSFLNVVILRSKTLESFSANNTFTPLAAKPSASPVKGRAGGVSRGRSHCPHCHKVLTWLELIPILSFVIQRGRCRHCRQQISVQYPLVEMTTGIIALMLFTPLPSTPLVLFNASLAAAIIASLIILFVIDLRTFLLPDAYIISLTVLAVIQIAVHTTTYNLKPTTSLWGALIGAGFLAILWLITRGRGIGVGDIKLMVPLGILFGPQHTAVLLFVAFLIGGMFAAALLLAKRVTMKTAIPFGPFLASVAILFLLMPQLPQKIITSTLGL